MKTEEEIRCKLREYEGLKKEHEDNPYVYSSQRNALEGAIETLKWIIS